MDRLRSYKVWPRGIGCSILRSLQSLSRQGLWCNTAESPHPHKTHRCQRLRAQKSRCRSLYSDLTGSFGLSRLRSHTALMARMLRPSLLSSSFRRPSRSLAAILLCTFTCLWTSQNLCARSSRIRSEFGASKQGRGSVEGSPPKQTLHST